MAARLVDPTHSSASGTTPNVLIISGFPWYTSELAVHHYLKDIYPAAAPVTTRLYTNPTNGASRGHCFVEYRLPPPTVTPNSAAAVVNDAGNSFPSTGTGVSEQSSSAAAQSSTEVEKSCDACLPPLLREVKRRVEEQPYESQFLKVRAYVLTSQRWSRAGQLPELPTDPPITRWCGRTGVLIGYGDEGFSVRGGRELGLPNTVTADGQVQLERLRKRLRSASARHASGRVSAE